MKRKTVGLIGVGRFGRMVVSHLRHRVRLRVFDRDPERISDLEEAAPLEEVCAAEVVVLSVPISHVERLCREIAPLLGPGQTVIDTCSVKTRPVAWMLAALPEGVDVLGTHPLFGPDSGKDGVAGLKIALCPARIATERYSRICEFLRSLELVLIETTPSEHDRQIALSQAIFHLIAQAVGRLEWGVKPISTPGPETFYRLVSTVQRDTHQLFLDMERENPFAAECRRQFIDEMVRIHRELESGQPRGSDGP